MKTNLTLVVLSFLITSAIQAQVTEGTIRGQVVDDQSATIPAAKVFLVGQGNTIFQATDLDGRFKYTAIKPGLYSLKVVSFGKDTTLISNLEIKPESLTNLGQITLQMSTIMGGVVDIPYVKPLTDDMSRIDIPTSDIKHSPLIQDPKALFVAMNSDIIMPEGTSDMIIRGSRPGDVIFYVDGIKSNDLNGVPGVGIGSMMGYTGGIPAKYGDTTGGVVILETKSYFDLYYAWKAKG